MTWSEDLGSWLHNIRQERGLDISTLAKQAAVGVGTVSRVEQGYKEVSLQTLLKLARAVNARLDDVVPILYSKSSIRDVFQLNSADLTTSTGISFSVVDRYLQWIRHNIEVVEDYELDELQNSLGYLEHEKDLSVSSFIRKGTTFILPTKQERYWEEIHIRDLETIFLNGGVVVNQDIGYFIKHAHRDSGKTHADFKKETELSGSVLSHAEKGYVLPSKLDSLLALEKFLGIEGRIVGFAWRTEELYSRFDQELLGKVRAGVKVPYPNEIELIESLIFRCKVWYYLWGKEDWPLFDRPLP